MKMSQTQIQEFIKENGFNNCVVNEENTPPGTLLCAFFLNKERRSRYTNKVPLFTFDEMNENDAEHNETELKIVTVSSVNFDFKCADDSEDEHSFKRYFITVLEDFSIFWVRHTDFFYQKSPK